MKLSQSSQSYVRAYASDNREVTSFTTAVENAIQRNKDNGYPIARYDASKKKPYMEYPDGRRIYAD